MDMSTALNAVREWPAVDQIVFVQQVWDQLAETGWKPELSDRQKDELDRRLAAYEADPTNVLTWEQVEDRVRRSQ